MKVYHLHNMIAPYRVPIFTELSRSLELLVRFSTRSTSDRVWNQPHSLSFPHRVGGSVVVYKAGRPLFLTFGAAGDVAAFQPDILWAVLTRSNALDVSLLARYAKIRSIPFVVWSGELPSKHARSGASVIEGFLDRMLCKSLQSAAGAVFYTQSAEVYARQRGFHGEAIVGGQILDPGFQAGGARYVARQDQEFRFAFVGKFEPRKGLDLLLAALSEIVSSRLHGSPACLQLDLVGGEPEDLWKVWSGPTPPGLLLRCHGRLRRDAAAAIMRKADALVLPSREDPWGFVINEAMSLGTPCICSLQAGAAELAAKAGWTFDVNRPETLLGALCSAIRGARNEELRRAAVEAVRHHDDLAGFSAKIHRLFRTLLQRGRPDHGLARARTL